MTAGIAEETGNNEAVNAAILAELARQGQILDRLAVLIPAMEQAARLLDNPVARYREALKGRKRDGH